MVYPSTERHRIYILSGNWCCHVHVLNVKNSMLNFIDQFVDFLVYWSETSLKEVMSVFRSGNFVFGYRYMTLLWTMKRFDRKYRPASWNFQETDLLLSEPSGFWPSRCTKIFLNSNCSSSYQEIYIIKAISKSHFLGTAKKITKVKL